LKPECPHIRQLLSEYIDGVLDTVNMTAVMEHLHACEDCSREHEALKSLIRELGNIRAVKAPDNFLEKLHDRMRDDSFFDRIREILSFTRIRFPVELAAFATTAILILFLFNFFPTKEKAVIGNFGNDKAQSALDQGTLPAQTADNQNSAGQPVESSNPATQTREQRIPVKLALSLTNGQDNTPIPSQSVSFGNSGTGHTDDDPDIWPSENDSTKNKIQPDDVNLKIDEIIKSVEGTVLSRDYQAETGYPAHLKLDIPGINYRRFISKIKTLGALQAPAPALPEGSEDARVLIQIELTPPE